MSNPMLSAMVAGAFAVALGSLATTSATAQMSKGDMEKMMKEKQAQTMKAMEGGKMEKCFGVALKGQNDCFAGAGRPAPERAARTTKATPSSSSPRAPARP